MNERLLNKLLKRKVSGTLRTLQIPKNGIDFFSNDYIGLSKFNIPISHEPNGSTGSRLLSGNSLEAERCELRLAEHFKAEAALIFNSGYVANVGLLSAVLQRGDLVLYDQYVHASSRDGLRLSLAESLSFKHNNIEDLRTKLKKSKAATNYVLVESLYSMDGDVAPLSEITELCKSLNAYLIVDEAHAGGVYGRGGRGMCIESQVESDVFARIVTFGKAYGCHGAVVLGSNTLKSFLVNFSRSFIYSTALPSSSYKVIEQLVTKTNIEERLQLLKQNITYFRKQCHSLEFLSDLNSPIQILEFENREILEDLVRRIRSHGIFTKAIYPPTVPEGKSRLRLCLHAFNTENEIDILTMCLLR